MKNWRFGTDPRFGLMARLSESIGRIEARRPLALPDIRRSDTILVSSDYGGQHRSATHETLSFMLVDASRYGTTNADRRRIRMRLLGNRRTMSFKGLNDRRKRAALLPFLRVADRTPGLLVTVATNKAIKSLFGEVDDRVGRFPFLQNWHHSRWERTLRIVHFVSFFIAGLSRKMQDVVWISDNDEIVANDRQRDDFLKLFEHICSQYLPNMMGHFRFGTTALDDKSRWFEDLASIPDLAAGMAAEYLAKGQGSSRMGSSRLLVPAPSSLSPKCRALAQWYADNKQPLKRLLLVIDEAGGSQLDFRWVQFHALDEPNSGLIQPANIDLIC